MNYLDSQTVAVETAAQLKEILETNNEVTTIYLAKDIKLELGGITILPSKTKITIDGFYPLDGTGTVHTLTEYTSADLSNTIGVRSASNLHITLKNMNIIGNNFFGTVYCPEIAAVRGVKIEYQKVKYEGPQICFHPEGSLRLIDCDITIKNGNPSPANEVAEIYQVEIGGNTKISHTNSTFSVFWYRGSTAPLLRILDNAKVDITSTSELYYDSGTGSLTMEFGKNSEFSLNSLNGVTRTTSDICKSVLVDTGANVNIIQRQRYAGKATMYCSGEFIVNDNASFYMQADFDANAPLLQFSTSTAKLSLNDPRCFALYSKNYRVFGFPTTIPTQFSFTTQQVNRWTDAKALATAGNIDDIPTHSWRKIKNAGLEISGRAIGNNTEVLTHNLTADDLKLVPDVSFLQLQTAKVFSVGRLPLSVDRITTDAMPITGKAPAGADVKSSWEDGVIVKSNAEGKFEIPVGSVIPVGTKVIVTDNTPFLRTFVEVVSEPPGELSLTYVTEDIVFTCAVLSLDPVIIKRADPDLKVIVSDTRVKRTPWTLYAAVTLPLVSEKNHVIESAVIFVDENATRKVLNATPSAVYRDSTKEDVVTILWPEPQGILLCTNDQPFYCNETYQTKVAWSVEPSS